MTNKTNYKFIIVCIITVIVKFSLFLYTKKLYKIHDSILIKSSMQDHKNDCIVTLCTLISIITQIVMKTIYLYPTGAEAISSIPFIFSYVFL